MKILRVIPSMDPEQGGPCQGIRNAIPAMRELGVQNEVVCFDPPDADYLDSDPFVIHTIGNGKTPWKYNARLIPWLTANFKNYDVVIVHALWLYHSYATIKAIKSFRNANTNSPKVYLMPHGMLDPYFQKATTRKWKALRNEFYWKIIENKVINSADGILFTCEEELLLARTTFTQYRPRREINVGYGVQSPPAYHEEMKASLAQKLPKWNGKPYLLFLSRIHPKKGVDLLIEAYLKLEQEIEYLPQLIIAGPGLEQTYGKEMQVRASSSPNIFFSGMLSGAAKWGAFYEFDSYILGGHQENFGIAVVEALACAKPVLISNKVNIWREIIRENGGIVKNDSQKETYHLLEEWSSLPKNKKLSMSKSAQEVYTRSFTIEEAAKNFVDGIRS